jgi:cellulose synthase/poly-beta-1,6-N-acetylglucosamine synthase-like glycosyltransferase
MNRAQKAQYWCWLTILLAALAYFWIWWLRPEHNIGTLGYILNLIVVAWVTLLPLYFILISFRARSPSHELPIPSGYRVAMVVTKVPSEPFPLVRETLEAMLRQNYPHDTWLADEDPSAETSRWCHEHGVMISTRKGQADYHRTSWPRRTRCKEGNLAFFYDHYGYANYDFVVQLDADHVPTEGYLEEMLRGFADRKVGYVSAPSICDKNAEESWCARGRLYVEGPLHGPLQAGYTGGLAPLCIGSHYAIRTIALKEIGGLGPELAEDHSTTLIMNAHGWRGVHAINAIAHGAGPQTFGDLVTQEFQWSRSLFTIFLKYTPVHFGKLPTRLKLQFAFSQLWYPLFSVLMLFMYLLPIAALLFDSNMVGVTYPDFFLHATLLWIVLIIMAFWWRKQQWLRPVDVKILSWEGTLFLYARWPWSLIGTFAAVLDWLRGNTLEFRVTPKERAAVEQLPLGVLAPYAFLSLASGLPVLLLGNVKVAVGFYLFAAINCLLYAILVAVIIVMHRRENQESSAIFRVNDSAIDRAVAIS